MTELKLRGRKVLIDIRIDNKGQVEHIQEEAVFHVWGYRKPKGPFVAGNLQPMETVAICERPDGKVRMVLPEKVKFLGAING